MTDAAGETYISDDRLRYICGIIKAVSQRYVHRLPVDIDHLCRLHGARMTTLEDAEALGLDRGIVLKCMGNRDGVATRGHKVWGIIYNKNAPINRLRFTLAEEFCHTILGHTLDPRFNALDPSYDEEVYRRYEAEAKLAADLLLIPPSVWFRYRRTVPAGGLEELFGVSGACLWTASQMYAARGRELMDAWGTGWLPTELAIRGLEKRARDMRPVPVE